MNRLVATLGVDVRLQLRNGFYYAVAFVLVGWLIVLTQLPPLDWGLLLPAIILGNLVMVSFYFVGGLVLLEKGEGTLHAQVVTPLGAGEYLASKVLTLGALSVVEHLVIVGTAFGPGFNVAALVVGVVLTSVCYTLVGFIAVARYDSINEYIFPSVFFIPALQLPLLHYFGIWDSWLMFLHPMQASLVIVTGAFRPLAATEWLYGLAYSAVWIVLLVRWNQRTFARFVVAEAGARTS